eukprot:UN07826
MKKGSRYVINKEVELDVQSPLFEEVFSKIFPHRDKLEVELAKFNFGKKIEDFENYNKGPFVDLMTFFFNIT